MSNSNIARRLAQAQPGTLHAGVDLALAENLVVVIDDYARKCVGFKFPQDADGYRYFLQKLEQVREKEGAKQVVVAMEPTNFFWKLLANHLEQQQRPYHLVNPFTVKKHREGDQLDRSKDDPRDGFMIAELDRTGKYTETRLQHGPYEELRQYATLYYQLNKHLRREKTILWGLVGQVFPELRQAFKQLDGITVKALLRTCPAAVSIRALSEADFLTQVQAAFTGTRIQLAKLRQAYRLAGTSIGLSEGLCANQLAIQLHLDQLELLEKQLLQIIAALKVCLQEVAVAPYLLSIKGLSSLSVALLLAEIGDPAYYRNGAQLVKLAGIQPVPNTSGRKQRRRTPMSHLGRANLRTVLYFACLRLVKVDPRFQQRYLELQTRAKNPLTKLQALGVLMNKLLHLVWALIQHQTFYNPAEVGLTA
jgi:transposase